MIDLLIGLGIPVLQMILRMLLLASRFPSLPFLSAPEFVVQGHRYDIWEDVGCYPTTVNTPPAYPLSFVWGPVIGLISAVYCSKTSPPRFLNTFINLPPSPHLARVYEAPRAIQPVRFIKHFTHCKPVLPPHVSRYLRTCVQPSNHLIRALPQHHLPPHLSLEKLV